MIADKREAIKRKLLSYKPFDTQEELYKQQILSFINQYLDCFERTQQAGHITGSAWLINKTGDKALLMHHAKLGLWVQPGGHCDGDPDVLGVALREAQEESGIFAIEPVFQDIFDLDVHRIPASKKESEHYHYDIRFLLRVTTDDSYIKNDESHELRWISKNKSDLPTNERSVVRMFEKWCALP